MMESIEKLRESLKACTSEAGVESNRFDTYWITARACDMLIDEIEAEIAEKYMELPVDADGVPIHVGDYLNWEYEEEKYPVCAVAPGRVHHWVQQDGKRSTVDYPPTQCTHYKPRTIEDVLRELVEYVTNSTNVDSYEKDIASYADEIRELMEVDE